MTSKALALVERVRATGLLEPGAPVVVLLSGGRDSVCLPAVTREETAAWCTQRGLAWREDRSNDSDVYARARVRHGLVPALRAVHPAAEANVLATSELLREEAEVLDVVVESALAGRDRIAL